MTRYVLHELPDNSEIAWQRGSPRGPTRNGSPGARENGASGAAATAAQGTGVDGRNASAVE